MFSPFGLLYWFVHKRHHVDKLVTHEEEFPSRRTDELKIIFQSIKSYKQTKKRSWTDKNQDGGTKLPVTAQFYVALILIRIIYSLLAKYLNKKLPAQKSGSESKKISQTASHFAPHSNYLKVKNEYR